MNISGTYVLVINVKHKTEISIGKLGIVHFKPGYYIYIGSALRGQLFNRVLRHIKPPYMKKMHWHIDYLLKSLNARIEKIFLLHSEERTECEIASNFRSISIGNIPNFGSSDCKCSSHLFYFGETASFL
ncbi:MAG: GIY-YIG nuclease family protein [Promethearchaeota archaeon]